MVSMESVGIILNLVAILMSIVSSFFMFYLAMNVGERRLHRIFQRLGVVMVGVIFAVSIGFLQYFYPEQYFLEIFVDFMVITSLILFIMTAGTIRDFAEEYAEISGKAEKFSKKIND